jgi:hypothetical protein
MLTIVELTKHIEAFALGITSQPLRHARHCPEVWGQRTNCFENVRRKVEQDGGGALSGWMFHYRRVLAIPGPGYLIAVNHAVWRASDGQLIDVTPFHADPTHHPVGPARGVIFFLTDAAAMPALVAYPSRFHPLTPDELMVKHVQRLSEEEEAIHRQMFAHADAEANKKNLGVEDQL